MEFPIIYSILRNDIEQFRLSLPLLDQQQLKQIADFCYVKRNLLMLLDVIPLIDFKLDYNYQRRLELEEEINQYQIISANNNCCYDLDYRLFDYYPELPISKDHFVNVLLSDPALIKRYGYLIFKLYQRQEIQQNLNQQDLKLKAVITNNFLANELICSVEGLSGLVIAIINQHTIIYI